MIDRKIIKKTLKRTQELDKTSGLKSMISKHDESCFISMLIYDIFGGEILKTHNKRGWHFYNRIDGERLDFAMPYKSRSSSRNHFEDLPATNDEPRYYFANEDYSTFFERFIRVFEEAVGLDQCKRNVAT